MDKIIHWIVIILNAKKLLTFGMTKIELHDFKVKVVFNDYKLYECSFIAF